jgi:flagellar hook-associated protein 2
MSGVILTGLSSGLDTTSIIDSLMKLERIPYEKLSTKKSNLEKQQSAIRSINTKLVTLRTAVSDLMYTSAYNITSAKTADNSVVNVSSTENAAVGTYDVTVTQLAKKHVVSSGEFAADGTELTNYLSETIKFYKDGSGLKEIDLSGENNREILNNLAAKINEAKVGVSASVIETKPGFLTLVFTSSNYGEQEAMTFASLPDPDDGEPQYPTEKFTYIDGSANFLEFLGIMRSSSDPNEEGKINTKVSAQNAIVTINGIQIEHGDNELENVVSGMTFSLLKENASTSVVVSRDVDKIAEKVQAFVDAYNEVVTAVRDNIKKGGALQGDSTLRMLQSELADQINRVVGGSGAYQFLFEIGLEIDKSITTGSEMTGKLNFDKNKFKEAFNKDPEAVYHLFAYDGPDRNDDGIAVRFYNFSFDWTKSNTGFLAAKIAGYDFEIKSITQQMEDMDLRLQNRQKQLETQFAAMETALGQLRNQQSWLSNQIATLGYY